MLKQTRKTGKEANAKGKMWIPVEDRAKVRKEGIGLQDYWLDCWQTDPFGNRWTLMCSGEEAASEIKSTTKAKYRKQLKAMRMFLFEERKDGKDKSLWVRNLHGVHTKYRNGVEQRAYETFLQSDYWQKVRQQVLSRDNHTCQHCSAIDRLHVHHLTYEHHKSEHEHLDDLITLCEVCHRKEHGIDD